MRYLRIVITEDNTVRDVLQSLQDMGYKFKTPDEEGYTGTIATENIKTVLVDGDEVKFFDEEVNPDPEKFTDMSLIELIKLKVKVWANISL
ncbi:hypothetical protein U2F14_09245 [Acinetobacter baumannii]|uniref:hypothetical protein n=1 Tax=Acinetobacter baumannii TaxID=470 RepID=UPI000B433B6D|nr:hypothetical protein [Acinetobacter baumannii]AVI31213.1 hypothetical protein CSB70_1018 [Acinetobacter baumannii]AVI38446.1 hypothetical protein CSB68_2206 [Acinetobacter baumannii]EHU1568259.1 hypothetical protein [Acinetobacter baumannii]EHU1625481.1 hypothetical protein [Acinetobacter baumannii]EHU1650177.1 hypothetical protein [Acinetobacter baumannii]